jgi:predicted nucleotide-binding protein
LVEDFRSHRFESEYIDAVRPQRAMSRDSAAAMEGVKIPPHLLLFAQVAADLSAKEFLGLLRDKITYVATYLEKRMKMKGTSAAKTGGSIFIGHGGSLVWRDLKDFIQERLGLEWDEFNRQPAAGLSTKERLEAMLDKAVFAFLVLTAEDESADGKKHARANVIHEAGLFQGRLGFKRAIVLLEEGCEEFSNIAGLAQIRFPPGKIEAKFEELRRVLEREKIIR